MTEDAQVFYDNSVDFANSHASVNKLKPPYVIVREDIENKGNNIAKLPNADEDFKEKKIEEAKILGLKVDKRMGIEKIESLIKDKENA